MKEKRPKDRVFKHTQNVITKMPSETEAQKTYHDMRSMR